MSASQAGRYATELDVPNAPAPLAEAIDRVVASYDRPDAHDQVLVQDMAAAVVRSGVVMTRDPVTGAPYVVIELSDGPRTDLVTSGRTRPVRIAVHHGAPREDIARAGVTDILAAVRDVVRCHGDDGPLDLEVAEGRDGRVVLLQARRLPLAHQASAEGDHDVARRLASLGDEVRRAQEPVVGIGGVSTILGQMPDWNPAELLGAHPTPLALSLFRFLISDGTWAHARAALGYHDVDRPLVHTLAGRPFVDVRASFNSFVPAGTPLRVRAALVEAWMDRLRREPALHDRVETDVAQTAVDLTFDATYRARYGSALLADADRGRWREALATLTARVMTTDSAGSLAAAMTRLRRWPSRWRHERSRDAAHSLAAAGRLLRGCRTDGALPFAIVARHAFIAESLLRSIVARGAWAPGRAAAFRASLATVAGALVRDLHRARHDRHARGRLRECYGHLRPGAFDVRSLPYVARGDAIWTAGDVAAPPRPPSFRPTAREVAAVDVLLRECGLPIGAEGAIAWIRAAIEARDRAKFRFNCGLSAFLEHAAGWTTAIDLTRDDLAHLTLADLAADGEALEAPALRAVADAARARRAAERSLRIGQLVFDPADLAVVRDYAVTPTFVTTHTVSGAPVTLDDTGAARHAVDGRIVCIESADPGYDWILARGPAALVTAFGGANSHMTLRCRELGLPAVIGIGTTTFDRLTTATTIELRCGESAIRDASLTGVAS